jgi:hypothetical protein
MTPIERAARALAVELGRKAGMYTRDSLASDGLKFSDGLRIPFIDQSDVDCGALVRAVVQALREPDSVMTHAGAEIVRKAHSEDGHAAFEGDAANVWRVMIDVVD